MHTYTITITHDDPLTHVVTRRDDIDVERSALIVVEPDAEDYDPDILHAIGSHLRFLRAL